MSLKTDLVERRNQLDAKSKTLKKAFEEAGPELEMDKVTVFEGDSIAKAKQFKTAHDEINALGEEVETMAAALKAAKELEDSQSDGDGEPARPKMKGADLDPEMYKLGKRFVESKAYKGRNTSEIGVIDVDIKTLMQTSAGWAPETTRNRPMIDYVTTPIDVLELIPTGTTDQIALTYMEETTFTNNAAEISEGGTYPEAALALTERSDSVRKVAVFIPVTDEQLEDVAGIQSYIDNRLTYMLRQRLNGQVLNGNGTAPNISGILDRSGLQTQALGADVVPDAIHKAITKVMLSGSGNGGANANAVFMHPNDWQQIRLLRTADGIYIWGSPADPGVARIWGLPVSQTQALSEGTGLVGDTNYVELAYKRGIELKVSDSHDTYFVEGKQAIRADVRCALAVYRPAAFCQVTGI